MAGCRVWAAVLRLGGERPRDHTGSTPGVPEPHELFTATGLSGRTLSVHGETMSGGKFSV